MRRTYLLLGFVIALVAGFLLFRPDKLFADDPVDESLDQAFATTTSPADQSTSISPAPPSSTPTTLDHSVTSPSIPVPMALANGQFSGIGHQATGTATIYEEDGRYVLRFEDDTDIQNGPDLYVWIIEGHTYESGVPSGYIDLGKLKGNVGGQNYELPAEFNPDLHGGVLIWCLRFAVPFAFAPLA
ncbi:MAG TPA: DM13 domain-containing protein [Acidimicrobiia bacterium]|nr:DM13 domain-containing protein [Acidimicrobiia bacterium]